MYQRILVPVDGSATSQRGLAEAIAVAKSAGGRLHLLHVIDELSFATSAAMGPGGFAGDLLPLLREGGEAILAEARAQAEAAGVPVDSALVDSFSGRVSDQVAEVARSWKADLIVLGTHGRRGVGRMLLGSDAEQILRTAAVPVLLVRAPDTTG